MITLSDLFDNVEILDCNPVVSIYDYDLGDFSLRKHWNDMTKRERSKVLDMEVKYIYPNTEPDGVFKSEVAILCIEVG